MMLAATYKYIFLSRLIKRPVSLTIVEDTPTTISGAALLANDTDADGDTLSIISAQAATHGTVSLVGSDILFTPTANYNGPASFTYTISDGHGGTSTATVGLNVSPVNDLPVAMPDTLITSTGTAITVPTSTLLANDSDVDGDSLSISAVSGGVNGSVSLSNGSVTFTPTANFNGIGTFNYTLSMATMALLPAKSLLKWQMLKVLRGLMY